MLEELPRNVMGKVNKKDLRRLAAERGQEPGPLPERAAVAAA